MRIEIEVRKGTVNELKSHEKKKGIEERERERERERDLR